MKPAHQGQEAAPSVRIGQRQTRQREVIARVIGAAVGPLTAREIHARAGVEQANVGIATVYRSLKLMLEQREVRCVMMPSGEPRYESAGRGHHDHFLCRVCEQVFDLGCPLRLKSGASLPGGFVVEDHEMTLFGLCPGCIVSQDAAATKNDQGP